MLNATKSCSDAMAEAWGIAIPRKETAVRPHRPNLPTHTNNPLYTPATIR
jgi:hypothetical protein